MPRRPRVPLWQLLVDRGLAQDEAAARALVMAGQVLVEGARADKAGAGVAPGAALRLRDVRRFASRGGEKLRFALSAFAVDPGGRVCLDCGASTGGFTDCLLQHGASRVYAVDAGFGQLLGRLRQDPRVVNMERRNLADVQASTLQPPPTLVTLDLSYLPLHRAWRLVDPWMPRGGDVLSLVKPLFEIDDMEARRTGRIEDAGAYRRALDGLCVAAADVGWSVLAAAASPVRGTGGTLEFFMHCRAAAGAGRPVDTAAVVTAATG